MNLFKFLEGEGIVEVFLFNCITQMILCQDEEFTLFEDIHGAFAWHSTPEGGDYWNDMDIKYEEQL